ncbi:hypothetical protein [Photorhabdus khanii]|uniref:hypothetical protein n=1 Tax=Photorhabdus khanii TaxID=1004150 RepID=UPI001EF04DEC|nr:hypothetical protein [Photorhabdus khanii]
MRKLVEVLQRPLQLNNANGANSAGEIVILFNHLHSMSVYNLTRELQEANKQGASTEAIWSKYGELSAAQRAEMLSDCAGKGGLCTLTYQAEMEGGIKTADAVSGLRWMFGLSEEDAHRLSQFVTTENQNDLGLLYNSLPAWEKGALIAKEAVESAGIGGAIGSKVSVASIVGKHRGSAIPVPEPIVASNGLTYKSNPKHTPGGDGNRKNAGIEPKDSLILFENSIPSSKNYNNKEVRFSVDKNGNVHRFEGTNGEYHWNGSSGDINNSLTSKQVPSDIQKKLGVKLK